MELMCQWITMDNNDWTLFIWHDPYETIQPSMILFPYADGSLTEPLAFSPASACHSMG